MKKNAVFTVADANKRWCPFGRTSDFNDGGDLPEFQHTLTGNRGQCHTRCIASDCMAWRWHTTHINNPDAPKGDLIETCDTYGYCGMAGAP